MLALFGFLIIILVTLLSVGRGPEVNNFEECIAAGNPAMESYPRQCMHEGRNFVEDIHVEEPIGGERSDRGCLGPAGYTYSDEVGACIREWELDGDKKYAARLAMEYVGWENGTTVIQVQAASCHGCFMVEVEQGMNRRKLTLEDFVVVEESMTPSECEAEGGIVVTTTGGATCEEGVFIGEVAGFISPAICCK